MDFEQVIASVNAVLQSTQERPLSELEIELLRGAWAALTYEDIATASGYSLNYLQRDVGPKFWKLLSEVYGRKLSKANARMILTQEAERRGHPRAAIAVNLAGTALSGGPVGLPENGAVGDAAQISAVVQSTISLANPSIDPVPASTTAGAATTAAWVIDWGEAPDVATFYGRAEELETLTRWIEADRCRLVALLGMGGIGKSTLAAKVATIMQGQFEVVIWRSLRNAPPLETVLADLIPFLSNQEDLKADPDRLLHWLRTRRCLVILDNVETVMQGGEQVGTYLPGYESYGDVLRQIGETRHQSCVILTSREKPQEVSLLEDPRGGVRSRRLVGDPEMALALLGDHTLRGSEADRRRLCEFYTHSPLALKIVAASIQTLFEGDIAAFLAVDTLVFNSIRRLLDQQFQRLSPLETCLMMWLAINREWVPLSTLATDVEPTTPRVALLEALDSLSGRSLIEQQQGQYTQQPVVMEYVTHRLVQRLMAEVEDPTQLEDFLHYALSKTTVKDYLRETQERLILQPVALHIRAVCQGEQALRSHLQTVLLPALRQATAHQAASYAAGNLLNLMRVLGLPLTGLDLSGLTLRHAYLQDTPLRHSSLAGAEIRQCRFMQTFGSVWALAFSPPGETPATPPRLAIGDLTGGVRIWQTTPSADGGLDLDRHLLTLLGHTSWVYTVSWHPQGHQLVSGSHDGTLRLWQAATGVCLKVLVGHGQSVNTVVFSPDGELIASSSHDHTVKLWHAATGQCLATLERDQAIWGVDWHPSGAFLASCSGNGTIQLWDRQGQPYGKALSLPGGSIKALAFSPDGTLLAIGSPDGTIVLWEVSSGQVRHILKGHQDGANSLAWHPDGHTLASCSGDRTARLWDVERGTCRQVLQGHQGILWVIAWSPDGSTLASGGDDQSFRLWNPHRGQCRSIFAGYINWMRRVVWSPDGSQLATGSTSRLVQLWDSKTQTCSASFSGHGSWVMSVAWMPPVNTALGQRYPAGVIASASIDQTVKLWDVATGTCLRTFRGHTDLVYTVDWSPDGTRLVSGSSTNERALRLWDVESGECLRVLTGHQGWIWRSVWSPDGTQIASTGQDNTVRLWDAATGTCRRVIHHDLMAGLTVAWSPDSQWIATTTFEGAIELWRVEGDEEPLRFLGHESLVWAVAFSPDGRTLASASDDATLKLWDRQTGQCLHTMTGHKGRVFAIAWHPDGQSVVSVGQDETLRLWDRQTGDCRWVMWSDRPYEGLDIAAVVGLTDSQRLTLTTLGAVDPPTPGTTLRGDRE